MDTRTHVTTGRLGAGAVALLTLAGTVLGAPSAGATVGAHAPSVVTQFGAGSADSGTRLAAMPDGSMLVGWTADNGTTTAVVVREVAPDGTVLWEHGVAPAPATTQRIGGIAVAADGMPVVAVVSTAPGGSVSTFVVKLDPASGHPTSSVVVQPTTGTGSFAAVALRASGSMLAVVGTGIGHFGMHATHKHDVVVAAMYASDLVVRWWGVIGTGGEDDALGAAATGSQMTVVGRTTPAAAADKFFVESLRMPDGKKLWKRNLPVGTDFSAGGIAIGGATTLVGAAGGVERLDAKGKPIGFLSTGAGTSVRAISVNLNGFVAAGTTTAGIEGVAGSGGTDAFTIAFDVANAPEWYDLRATPAADAATDAVFDGSAFVVAGTTAGQLAGTQSDATGDVFVASYAPALPLRPTPPQNLATQIAAKTVVITWDAPADTSGLPVTYAVTIRNLGTGKLVSKLSTTTTATSYVVSRSALQAGAVYNVSVIATTVAGSSVAGTLLVL